MGPLSYISNLIDTVLFGSELRCPACGRPADSDGMWQGVQGRIPYVLPTCLLAMWSAAAGAGGDGKHALPIKAIRSARAASLRTIISAEPELLPCTTAQHGIMSMNSSTGHERNWLRARRMMAEVAICDGMAAECDCVVPVPLHYEKAARRGFNQAELLARDVGLLLEFQWRLGPSIARSGEEAKRFWTRAIVVLTW